MFATVEPNERRFPLPVPPLRTAKKKTPGLRTDPGHFLHLPPKLLGVILERFIYKMGSWANLRGPKHGRSDSLFKTD